MAEQTQYGSLSTMTATNNDFGHRRYQHVNPARGELRFECGQIGEEPSYSMVTSVVESWTGSKTQGEYGGGDWVSLGYRNNHYACGTSVLPPGDNRTSIGACGGIGGSGSWRNHRVSYNNWSGGRVGCNGSELQNAQIAIWFRPDEL